MINVGIISEPQNWVRVLLMVTIGFIALDCIGRAVTNEKGI